jgi:hypothetical protein
VEGEKDEEGGWEEDGAEETATVGATNCVKAGIWALKL